VREIGECKRGDRRLCEYCGRAVRRGTRAHALRLGWHLSCRRRAIEAEAGGRRCPMCGGETRVRVDEEGNAWLECKRRAPFLPGYLVCGYSELLRPAHETSYT